MSLALCIGTLLPGCPSSSVTLPSLGEVPPFSLLDHNGHRFTDQNLKHKVSIVSFMFTSCPSVCPMLVQRISVLQQRLRRRKPRTQFVSFSVDPEVDTPARLTQYAKARALDLSNWSFVTGDSLSIRQVAVRGFKQGMGTRSPSLEKTGAYDILHGTHLVLVDREGVIRGYYGTDDAGLSSLERDATYLARR